MDDRVQVVSSGIGFDGLLILLGTIFCILKGADVLSEGFTWVYCCIPFMIIGAEIGLAILLGIICFIIAWISGFKQYDKED